MPSHWYPDEPVQQALPCRQVLCKLHRCVWMLLCWAHPYCVGLHQLEEQQAR